MAKYVLEFSKTGVICYISHLDMMRVFHRAFKRAGIDLEYSQGFNPHPKLVFAQPLSLGYRGLQEYLEFDIKEEPDPGEVRDRLAAMMPEGLDLKGCRRLELTRKTLAAITDAASYTAVIPWKGEDGDGDELKERYLAQDRITVMKKQKKKKELKEIDIKPMIRELAFTMGEDEDGDRILTLDMLLDQGSISNLSPEHVINTVIAMFTPETDRSEVTVTRDHIYFAEGYEI